MNSKLHFVFARRSIRAYQPQDVGESLVQDLLEAAMAAPSAVAKDPWHFVILRNRNLLAKVAQGLPNGTMLANAPVGIVVCGDRQRAHDGQLSYLLQDCSAAIENILIAAHALGLGAVWLGGYPNMEIVNGLKDLFQVPDPFNSLGIISLGYPAETKPPRENYEKARVHLNKW